MPPRSAPDRAGDGSASQSGPDFSGLEKHCSRSQKPDRGMQRPDNIEHFDRRVPQRVEPKSAPRHHRGDARRAIESIEE